MEINIDESVRSCLIPAFTLQPLVENALRHGNLDTKVDGQIVIQADRIENDVHIRVIDNGSGITPQRLQEVRNQCLNSNTAPSEHIGVQNVHQRIRLLFGEEYGLQIFSEPKHFTEINISIPFQMPDTNKTEGEKQS